MLFDVRLLHDRLILRHLYDLIRAICFSIDFVFVSYFDLRLDFTSFLLFFVCFDKRFDFIIFFVYFDLRLDVIFLFVFLLNWGFLDLRNLLLVA